MQRVVNLTTRSGRLITLRVRGQAIETTHEHPWWVVGKGWVTANALAAGDVFVTSGHTEVTLESVEDADRYVAVYNLEVEADHTYFVGDESWGFDVWSHNQHDFPANPNDLTTRLGIQPTEVGVTPDGTVRMVWEPTPNTRSRYESHPDGLKPGDPGFHPRHHGEHYHVIEKPAGKSWNQAEKQGLVTKKLPPGYTQGQGTGFLPEKQIP